MDQALTDVLREHYVQIRRMRLQEVSEIERLLGMESTEKKLRDRVADLERRLLAAGVSSNLRASVPIDRF